MSIDNNIIEDDFLIRYIRMIADLYEGEKFLYEKILNKISRKSENFVLFDKDWLDKWKEFIGYEILKEKCIKNRRDKDIKKILNEVRELFIKLNTKQNLDALGKMDGSKLKNKSSKLVKIDEKSNFIPILANYCSYFMMFIICPLTITSEISNGIIYIHDPYKNRNEEQKLILLYKENKDNKEFSKAVITLEPSKNINNVIKELSKRNINEILNQSSYKIEIFKEKEEDKNTNLKKENDIIKISKENIDETLGQSSYKIKAFKEKDENEDENTKLKKENNILIKRNQELLEENIKLKEIIEKEKLIRKNLEEENKKLKEKIKSLEKEINNKNEELKKYLYLNDIDNSDLNQNMIISKQSGEKIISVLFMTMGNQDIFNYSMPCRTTDLFVKLEEKLYNEFPKYKDYETYFQVNVRRIKRFKTIEENKIKSNDIISMFVIEN